MVEAALGGAWLERNLTLLTEKVDGGGEFDAVVDSLTNPQVRNNPMKASEIADA